MKHSESTASPRRSALRAISLLARLYPSAGTSLLHRTDRFRFLISVVLSAQCTDAKVNRVTPVLFRTWPRPSALAAAPAPELERVLKPLGLYRTKARHVQAIAAAATEGAIEWSMEGLTRLPGVGRKTANVVMAETGDRPEGIAVDTHCGRLSRRLGWTSQKDPLRVEQDLLELFPRRHWGRVTHLLIAHGRAVCRSRRPRCSDCRLAPLCPSAFRVAGASRRAA